MKRTRLTHVEGATVEREFVHCDQCDRELGMYEVGQAPSEPHLCNTKICKMKDKTTPTIAELWGEAEYLIELTIPHYEGLANPKNRVNEERRPIYVAGLAKCNARLRELRQLLVERCERVSDREGCYTEFEVNGGSVKAILYLPNGSRFSGSRKDDANSAREMSAAYAFWAWELEQRQREKEAQNG